MVESEPQIVKNSSQEFKSIFRSMTEYDFTDFYTNKWRVEIDTIYSGPVLYYSISCSSCKTRSIFSNAEVDAAISILNKVD